MSRPPVTDAEAALSRRSFMKLAGLSAAAATLHGCVVPPESRILPFAHHPPELVPGIPVDYATAMTVDGWATGLLVRTREGRPIKVEGNPLHPASLGAAGVFEQASVLGLYDPARARRIVRGSEPRSWQAVRREVLGAVPAGGRGLHLQMEPNTSPLRGFLLERVQEAFPEARVHLHAPLGAPPALEGFRRAAGRPLLPRYRFDSAEVVVALDADFVSGMPFHLRYARDFATRRRLPAPSAGMSRLYAAEPVPSGVAAMADHHLRVRTADVPFLLAALARELGVTAGSLPDLPERMRGARVGAFVRGAARDLRERPGAGLVLAGESQPPVAHVLAWRINQALGNAGRTVELQEPALLRPDLLATDLEGLADALDAGEVRTLLVLEGDPAYTAPADLNLGAALARVPTSLYLGLHRNATARHCLWNVPALHFMEAWGDARAYDGTLTPVQPLVRPLFGGRGPEALLLALLGRPEAEPRAALRELWTRAGWTPDRAAWEDALRRGVVEGTAAPAVAPTFTEGGLAGLVAELEAVPDTLSASFRADPCLHDGRFATNAWLQELPDPHTKLTWGNAALLSPTTASELGVEAGDRVTVEREARSIVVPALPSPGVADGEVVLRLGHGREATGEEDAAFEADQGVLRLARGVDVFPLRTRERPRHAPVTLAREGGRTPLAITQHEWDAHGRDPVLSRTLEAYRADPDFAARHRGPVATLYDPPRVRPADHQWAMTIDLTLCTGCSACVVACQAENNVPTVGPEEVDKGREMHWLRIDRYVEGSARDPEGYPRQPMLCQHCEKAPCEYVCPVGATVHSADGLNEMVYNRCVGTRFCSNNCPYKVRRFNWYDYNEARPPVERLVLNPDVTVRERGVMEKCTYCVQRIRRAEHEARREGHPLEPARVVTACQQTCPARAIVFGDLNEVDGALARSREDPRRYAVLHELGTDPRTQYLARITNPGDPG